MTRSEVIEILKKHHMWTGEPSEVVDVRLENEALQMAIDSLEADEAYQLEYEPTTKNDLGVDCISRKAVLSTLDNMDSALDEDRTIDSYKELLIACYQELPSVTPESKTGHWITKSNIYGVAFCSECGFELRIDDTKYCPNCGCRMVEPQESEDKE